MKKLFLGIILTLSFNFCLADQLAYITLTQAKEAEHYLKTTEYVLIWCGCCENDIPELVTTENVYYKKVNYKDFYQVVLEGKNEKGEYVSRDLDLAYVHSLENGFFKAVGKILNYKCDPCTEPFKLDNYNNIKPTKHNTDDSYKFYLGESLKPTNKNFKLIGISSKTNVSSYRFTGNLNDKYYYGRQIDDIIVGIKNDIIVTTIYNLIPKKSDSGVPKDIIELIQKNLPYPLTYRDGIYGLNIDNTTISISRSKNAMTFNKDRIMFLTSVKQSILRQ